MRLFFLFFSFFAASFGVHGQDDYVFENFSTKQGLLNNEVNRIVQDKEGYIWVSTTEGISRFDGHHFVNFRLSDKRLTHVLTIDEKGVIWAANNQAIYQYDKAQNCFKKYLSVWVKPNYQIQANAAVKGASVISLLSYQGTLWFAFNEGLYRIQNKTLKKTSLPNILLPNHLIGLRNSTLLLTTYHGTFIYDIARDTYRFLPQIKNPQSVYIDRQQRIWWGDMGYLYRMNADSSVQKWVIKLPNALIGVVSAVTFISPLPIQLGTDSLLWVGTFGQGIYQFDLPSERFINRINVQLGVKNGLSSNQVRRLFIDQNQNSWISSDNGIDKFDPHLFRFRTEEFPFFYELGIERLRQVIAIPNQPHLCWVITSGDGFFLYNRRKKQLLRRFLFGQTLDRQQNNMIYEAKMDSEQTLWVSLPKAILRVNPRTFQTQRIALPLEEKSGSCIDFDNAQTIGIGSSSGQIFFLNRKTLQLKQLPTEGYAFNDVFDILWDSSRKCWWFSTEQGLFSYDIRQHKINKMYPNLVDKIAIDREKNIWFTVSNNFLIKYDPEQQSIHKYKPAFSPENFHPKGLVIDRNGVVWMNTFKGLYAFSPKNQHFQVFGETEGLSSELSYGFLYDDGTGRIYLNYSYGFTSFNPYQTVLPRQNVTPQITGLSVEDSLHSFSSEKFLKIRNKNSRLRFEWVHLDYTQSSKTHFYYQLEGVDTQWRLNGNTTSVIYNNLNDGEYIFRVYAVNSIGKKSPVSAGVRIEIWRPFWEKQWFGWLMGFVLCSLGVWALLLYRYRQQLKLLKLRDDIARDLHDDMGSYLSSIQIQSQAAALVMHHNPELAQSMLHKIGHTTRHVMGTLRDLVWAINPEHDSFEQLLNRMKETAILLLEAHDIQLHFEVDANVHQLSIEMNRRKELMMIFKEAINNVAKHAQAQNVRVKITVIHKDIQLTVSDDGQGFEPIFSKNGNGLKNFQKRAQKLGGQLTIDANRGKGVTLFLTFPSHHRGIVA